MNFFLTFCHVTIINFGLSYWDFVTNQHKAVSHCKVKVKRFTIFPYVLELKRVVYILFVFMPLGE